jgi:hypothetical protein
VERSETVIIIMSFVYNTDIVAAQNSLAPPKPAVVADKMSNYAT